VGIAHLFYLNINSYLLRRIYMKFSIFIKAVFMVSSMFSSYYSSACSNGDDLPWKVISLHPDPFVSGKCYPVRIELPYRYRNEVLTKAYVRFLPEGYVKPFSSDKVYKYSNLGEDDAHFEAELNIVNDEDKAISSINMCLSINVAATTMLNVIYEIDRANYKAGQSFPACGPTLYSIVGISKKMKESTSSNK
jgi:hypothetical protein